MKLIDKYYKLYIRYLKEHMSKSWYDRNYDSYDLVVSNYFLPHDFYNSPFKNTCDEKQFFNEYMKDIGNILKERLDAIDINTFMILGHKFKDKTSILKFILSHYYLYVGLTSIDYHIVKYTKGMCIIKPSYLLIKENFYEDN